MFVPFSCKSDLKSNRVTLYARCTFADGPIGGEAEAASAAAGSAGSSTAASDTTTASAAGSSPATKERHAGQVGYNTLLKLQGEDATSREGVSFGQYLARKWGDVFRG